MVRISRQTLVPGLGLVLAVGLAGAVTLGAQRRPEARLRQAVLGYAGALTVGDLRAVARYRADRDPAPEVRRAEALRGAHWVLRRIELAEGSEEARVTLLWVDGAGRQQAERQLWAREDADRWVFVALTR